MDEQWTRVIVTVVAGVILSAGGWVWSTVRENAQAIQVQAAETRALEARIVDLNKQHDFLVERVIELHPMQRSALADLLAMNFSCIDGLDCRSDDDCGGGYCDDWEGCVCE